MKYIYLIVYRSITYIGNAIVARDKKIESAQDVAEIRGALGYPDPSICNVILLKECTAGEDWRQYVELPQQEPQPEPPQEPQLPKKNGWNVSAGSVTIAVLLLLLGAVLLIYGVIGLP